MQQIQEPYLWNTWETPFSITFVDYANESLIDLIADLRRVFREFVQICFEKVDLGPEVPMFLVGTVRR